MKVAWLLTQLTRLLFFTDLLRLIYTQEDEFEEVEVDVKYKTVTTLDWERVNANVAIWARDKDEITDDEYHNFYKVCIACVLCACGEHSSKIQHTGGQVPGRRV